MCVRERVCVCLNALSKYTLMWELWLSARVRVNK